MKDFKIADESLIDYIGLDEDVVIPEGVRSISSCAFAGNKNIKSIVLPDSIHMIFPGAFKGCINLESITMPDQLIIVHEDVFEGCEKLADENGFFIVHNILYKYFGKESRVVVPEGVVEIAPTAFAENIYIEEVVLPDSIDLIDFWAFYNCFNLESIQYPETLVKIGEEVFMNCFKLADENDYFIINGIQCNYFGEDEDITIPESVKEMKCYAFNEDNKIETIRIPKTVQNIELHTFVGCKNLKYIIFEDHDTLVNNKYILRYTKATMISKTEFGINRLDTKETDFNFLHHQEEKEEVIAYS